MNFSTGSLSFSFPSSCNMRMETAVNGLVIEATQKRVSGSMGFFFAMSAKPMVSTARNFSFVATTVTAPEISCASINFSIAARMAGFSGSAARANPGKNAQARNIAARMNRGWLTPAPQGKAWLILVLALKCGAKPQRDFSQVSLRRDILSGPGKSGGIGMVTAPVAAHWTPRDN